MLACTTTEKDTATAGDTAENNQRHERTQPDAFVVSEGTYVLTEPVYVDDGCGLDEGEDDEDDEEAGTLVIASTTDARYSVTLEDEFVFNCGIDDRTMSCDDLVVNTESSDEWEATRIPASLLPWCLAQSTFDATAGMTFSCEGADCRC